MGAVVELPFATQEGQSSSPQNSRERLVNMYVEVETDARRKIIRKQRACTVFYTEGIGTSRRLIEKFGDTNYYLSDDTLYTIGAYNDAPASFATIPAAGAGRTNRVTMVVDDNGSVFISDGIAGYYCPSTGGAMSVVSTPTAVGPVTFLAGYGIYSVPGAQQFYVSGLNNLNSWNALDFASAESRSDDLVRPFADHDELWLFGTRTIEIWGLSGGTDFPFAALTNATIQQGCAAALSVASGDNGIFWLGDDLLVYRTQGFQPVRISTHSEERLIADIPAGIRSDAEAFIYTLKGHKFYTIRFPGYLTLQYNIATGLWNEASTFGHNDWDIVGPNGTFADYVLTAVNVCTLDDSVNQDDESTTLLRKAISAPIWADGKRVSLRSFFLDVEVGRAPITTSDPQIMLRYAPDGETFGNIRSRSVGNIGEYQTRVIWRNVGFGRRGTVEISATDDFPLKIVGSDGNISVASS